MSINNDILIVRRNDFLAQLSEKDYEVLDIAHNVLTASRNNYIYFDAHQLNKLFFVKEGFVRIGNIDDEGNEFVRDILQPGDVFGQLTLQADNLGGEFAQAHKGPVVLCSFTVHKFEQLLQHRPDLSIVFAKKVGQRMRRIENRLLNLLQRDVRTRLLYFFWTLLPDREAAFPGVVKISNYLTHEDIARLTGTSRQTVTTFVNQFAQDGLLEVGRRQIIVHDPRLLQKEAKVG